MADLDGGDPHEAARLVGGGLAGWFPDSRRLLVTNRGSAGADPRLSILTLADGSLTTLAQAKSVRSPSLSPEGGWVAYQVAFSGDPAHDGLWVVATDGSLIRRLEVFGSYRWRAEGQLLIVPLDSFTGSSSHRLLQVDLPAGAPRLLTDPAQTPFRIANGDWIVSADGNSVVFVSAQDRNLWLIDLSGV